MRQRYRFVVVGYVIMPDHVHLLISGPEQGTPSTVVQAIKLGFARRVLGPKGVTHVSRFLPDVGNHCHVCGLGNDVSENRIWQRRFYDFNVWTDRKRIEKLRYMHRNSVVRGLVTEPDQWAWSSFRAYRYGESGPVRVNHSEVLDKIDFSGIAG